MMWSYLLSLASRRSIATYVTRSSATLLVLLQKAIGLFFILIFSKLLVTIYSANLRLLPVACCLLPVLGKVGCSPCHLPWEARLRIAKGVARGLSFLHDKKHVHGNLKPSNILLGSDMEPRVGDFGLERLVTGDSSYKSSGSTRNFGSKRSTASRDSFQDFSIGPSPSPSPSSIGGLSPYHAPEMLRSLKPNPKWDVYSFGVILLELLTGKVIVVDELSQGYNGLAVEDKNRAIRMADVAIRADLEGKEETLLSCFKLGYSCASPVPQKRPTMKEVAQVLEKIPCSSSSSHLYGH